MNGVYEADTTGDFDKIGTAFSNGDYVLLFERAGKVLSNRNKIRRDRWLIFNDEEGVHGDRPYYELLGKYSEFNGQWRVVSGAGDECRPRIVAFPAFFCLLRCSSGACARRPRPQGGGRGRRRRR